MAEDFTWSDGERLIRFGAGAVGEAPALLERRGFGDYALLTTPRTQEMAPELAERAAAVLHVPAAQVPQASAAVREDVGGRPVVALGGGRVIDSAKAIGGADGLAVAAIPTTLSGAPMTPFHRMPEGIDRYGLVRPSLVIAEPEVMASQPMPDLAASALNAAAHAVEATYGPTGSPVTYMAALRALGLFSHAFAGDEPRRDELALASVLAGYAVGSAGFAIHHAVCQTIVRVLDTPHAKTNAVMLPRSVQFVKQRAPEAVEEIDLAAVTRLAGHAGVTRLGELGVREDQVGDVVDQVLRHPALGNTPGGAPTAAELTALLEGAL